GLGLSIVRALVGLMDGEISVDSQQGVGTTFVTRFTLKVAAQLEKPEPAVSEPQPPLPAGKRARVLVVEDYAPNVMVAEMLLDELGYECDVCLSGEEAVARVEAMTEPYYAIL